MRGSLRGGANTRPPAGSVRTLDIGPSFSVGWLRIFAFALSAVLGLSLWQNTPLVLVPLAFFAASVLVPVVLLPLGSLLLIAGSYAAIVPGGSWAVFPYAAGLHLLFVCYALLLGIPRRTDLSTAAALQFLVRAGKIQLLVQPAAAVALLVQDAGTQPVLVAIACAALGGWAFWLLRTLRRT
ncbi:hypothetical protein GCM10027404_05020 [Arthrobacter tumbae]|uniref:hypothetical protein n=1 Tax=Arthrobacter tumbae TaxID=163874 RepID=UPI001957C2DC|nr:hypothetical protein [Arthrobacter tumbae]MBM7780055.1 hypothetical protein [Arthrobacter tumbae]